MRYVCVQGILLCLSKGLAVKEKPQKRQQEMLGQDHIHSTQSPAPGLVWCLWSPSAITVAQGVPVGGERQQRSSVSVQRKRPSIGLTVASVWTTWWLLKQTTASHHNTSWSGIHRVCLEEWLNVFQLQSESTHLWQKALLGTSVPKEVTTGYKTENEQVFCTRHT